MARKAAAINLYASQLGPLERDHLLSERLAANVPEQFWRLAPPPEGWEALIEADDLDAAIELASRVPAARMGGAVEVRPMVEG